jgi:hypothetical protein
MLSTFNTIAGNKHFRDAISNALDEVSFSLNTKVLSLDLLMTPFLTLKKLAQYMRADSRFDKGLVVHKIVEGIRSTGGRFLKKDRASNRWDELTIQATKDKVAHAIRDAVSASALRKSKEDLKPAAVARPQKRPRDGDVAPAASAAAAYPTSITSQPQSGGPTLQFCQHLEALVPQVEPTRAHMSHMSTTDVPTQHPQPEARREDYSHSPIPFHGHRSTAVTRQGPQMMRLPAFAAPAHYAVPQPLHLPSTQHQFGDSTRGFQMQHHPTLAVAAMHNVPPSTFSFRQPEQQSTEGYATRHPYVGEDTTAAFHRMIPPPESAAAARGVTAQFPTMGAAPRAHLFYQDLHVATRLPEPPLPLPPQQQQHQQQQQHLLAVPAAAGAVSRDGQPTAAQDPDSFDSFIEEIESVLGPLPPEHEDTMDRTLKSQQRHHPPR